MEIGLCCGITGQNFPQISVFLWRFEASHTPAEVLKTVTLLDTPGILAGNWIGVSSKITAFASNVLVKKDKDQHLWGKNKLFFNSWEKQLETGIHDFTISFKDLLHFSFLLFNLLYFTPQERNSRWTGDMTSQEFSAGSQRELIGEEWKWGNK